MALAMAVTDRFDPERHATRAAFMAELVELVNAFWREAGTDGCTITIATYGDDIATIETRPGPAAITLADVRAACARKEAA